MDPPSIYITMWYKHEADPSYISDIIVQAMNALHGMDSCWKEVVGDYMKE